MSESWACIADVQIKTAGKRGTITVDGHDLSAAVVAVGFTAEAAEMPVVTLQLAYPSVLFEGEAEVKLPEATVEALVRLGWTRPGCCECAR